MADCGDFRVAADGEGGFVAACLTICAVRAGAHAAAAGGDELRGRVGKERREDPLAGIRKSLASPAPARPRAIRCANTLRGRASPPAC